MENKFLGAEFDLPQQNSNKKYNYFKIPNGESRLRIVGKPIAGHVKWADGKSVKVHFNPQLMSDPDFKLIWTFPIYDFSSERVIVWEVRQRSIMAAIKELNDSTEWPQLTEFDIKVTKTGENLETKYVVTPCPPSPTNPEILAKVTEANLDLNKMFEEAPF